MKIQNKIILTILPLLLLFFAIVFGTSYYNSKSALERLAKEWLSTRSNEAVEIAKSHEQILHEYGLAHISASIAKAKLDAVKEISSITIGKSGILFGVDAEGVIFFHPDKYLVGTVVTEEPWFQYLDQSHHPFSLRHKDEAYFAVAGFYPQWNWYFLAAVSKAEVYGQVKPVRLSVILIILIGALLISASVIFAIKHFLSPLDKLLSDTEKIGQGDLDTRISIDTTDEFSSIALCVNQMVGQLKAGLSRLENREEYFRSLIENATDLITISDARGNITYSSPSTRRILGYEPEALVGLNVFEFIHPDEKKDLFNYFQKRISSEQTARHIEFRFKHAEGYWCTLEAMSSNLLDHPVVQGFVVNARNISRQKQMAQQLKESNDLLESRVAQQTNELIAANDALSNEIKARQDYETRIYETNRDMHEFIHSFGYETRTHLSSIFGFIQLLKLKNSSLKNNDYLNIIQQSAEDLLSLTNNITGLSSLQQAN
jgi:PAS domain S-box-containing protein